MKLILKMHYGLYKFTKKYCHGFIIPIIHFELQNANCGILIKFPFHIFVEAILSSLFID